MPGPTNEIVLIRNIVYFVDVVFFLTLRNTLQGVRSALNLTGTMEEPQAETQAPQMAHTVKNDRLKQPKKIGYLSWSRTTRLK